MKPQTSETREQIWGRDGKSSSTSALSIQAEGNTFSLTLAKIIAPVEFCIVAGHPPDTSLFKFAARRSARAATSPLPALILAAYLQYCSLVLSVILNVQNFITGVRNLNPGEQSTPYLVQSQCLNVTLRTPWVSEGWRDVTQSPFTHAFWLLKSSWLHLNSSLKLIWESTFPFGRWFPGRG